MRSAPAEEVEEVGMPPSAEAWPDRAALSRDQAQALDALIREDLSLRRGLLSALCTAAVVVSAAVAPGVFDELLSGGADGMALAVSLVMSAVLLAVFLVVPLAVLWRMRGRSARRWALLRAWAAVDRRPDADALLVGTPGPGRSLLRTAGDYRRDLRASLRVLGVIPLTAGVVLACFGVLDREVGWGAADAGVVLAVAGWATLAKYVRRYFWWSREQEIRRREGGGSPNPPPLPEKAPHPLTRAWLVLALVGALMLGLVVLMIVTCD